MEERIPVSLTLSCSVYLPICLGEEKNGNEDPRKLHHLPNNICKYLIGISALDILRPRLPSELFAELNCSLTGTWDLIRWCLSSLLFQ